MRNLGKSPAGSLVSPLPMIFRVSSIVRLESFWML